MKILVNRLLAVAMIRVGCTLASAGQSPWFEGGSPFGENEGFWTQPETLRSTTYVLRHISCVMWRVDSCEVTRREHRLQRVLMGAFCYPVTATAAWADLTPAARKAALLRRVRSVVNVFCSRLSRA
jgi:hypothetical protein